MKFISLNKYIKKVAQAVFCCTLAGVAAITVAAAVVRPGCANAAENTEYAAVYNIKKAPYNAKSGKDATAAIQKALNNAAKKGKPDMRAQVYVPKGTYYITGTLQIGSNTYLNCDKNAKFIKKSIGGRVPTYMLCSNRKNKKGYDGLKNVTVEGGIWDAKFMKYNSQTGGSLFFFAHSSNLEFINVTLKNCYGTHLLELGGTKDVLVKGCNLSGFKKSANNDDKEAIQLDVCHNDDILPNGKPYDDTPCMNIVIEDCEISDYPRAIGSHSYVKDIYPKNITIKNNYIHDISQNAIYGYNYINLSVTKNKFKKVYAGVVFRSYSTEGKETIFNRNRGVKAMSIPNRRYGLVIADNTISTTSKNLSGNTMQLGIFVYGTPEYEINDVVISNNTIKSASTGIYLRNVNSSFITNNSCIRNNNSSGGSFLVDGYKFLSCSNDTIQNNVVNGGKNNYDNGFAFRESCKYVKLLNNVINNVGKHGIGLYNGSSAEITGNTVSGAGQHGITLVDKSSASIVSNAISGCKDNGITVVESSAVRINDNNLSSNGTGMSIQKSSTVSEILNNDIFMSSGKSIAINSSTVPKVSGNTMLSNGNEWEVTAVSSSTNISGFKTLTCNEITQSTKVVSGTCHKNMKVYAVIKGNKISATVNKTEYTINIPTQAAGTQLTIVQEDESGNKVSLVKTVN